MSLPGNGIFVVRGELATLITAMRRGNRWSSHSHQDDDLDGLSRSLQDLKTVLNKVEDLRVMEPNVYLGPFLEVIRSEETTGPVTSLALSAVNKFLSYGLIDPMHGAVALTIHNIADAVTHARFVGTDQSSDAVVLMKILQVLRTLTLAPEGASLTNESLCEIMLSCFRIAFETRLNELLRKTAEHYLKDMVQLVFMRLPQFAEDPRVANMKFLKMKAGNVEPTRTKKKSRSASFKTNKSKIDSEGVQSTLTTNVQSATHVVNQPANIVDMQGSISQNNAESSERAPSPTVDKKSEEGEQETPAENNTVEPSSPNIEADNAQKECNENPDQQADLKTNTDIELSTSTNSQPDSLPYEQSNQQEYINQQGVRFTPQIEEEIALIPYGLASVRELFRFLISLCNPMDKQNSEAMIHVALTLLTVAFEVGADSIEKYSSLLVLVKDDLCRSLFSLLNSERLSVFAADLQVSFLMFESLRTHLKFQLEFYLTKLIDIIVSDSVKITYEHKELALDNILQLWRIPGFVTELYLNFDCDMYCSNLYEDLTKLLAKNAFPVTAGVYPTHLLSLDALLTVIESIGNHCTKALESATETIAERAEDVEHIEKYIGKNHRQKVSNIVPTREQLSAVKNTKRWLPTGTEHFNHKPKKGIQFLQEHGVLKLELDPQEIVTFLRENPNLDKKMIGEYISSRNNLQILEAFVNRFDFTGMRVDEALRLYLETFRLPGEAPLISLLLEHFAEHWHKCNGEPFANADAAFTLAYAVIMLNVDQHNHNVKKQNIPMTPEDFKKNLKKVNGGQDFNQDMLDEIYNSIRNEEIVMPAEQTGIVRENYLWKVLLRRGASKDGIYIHTASDTYDYDLFTLIWGPTVTALSFVFDKSEDASVYKRALQGFERCAFISSHFGITANLDMLVLTLCKFTQFNSQQKQNCSAVQFGMNSKAQLAFKNVFGLLHHFGDNVREGWKNVFDLILAMYMHNLLPATYLEAEDFIDVSGKIVLEFEEVQTLPKQDTGLFSSLYSYMLSSENPSKMPSLEEQECIDLAKKCIHESNLEQVVTDSKFLHDDSLLEMVKTLVELSRGPDVQKSLGYNYNENVTVFFLELLVKVVIQNRDRVIIIWPVVRDHLYTLVMNASHCDYQFLLERAVIGLLRLAIRLMRNEEMSPIVVQSLRMLLLLKSTTLFRISRQISFGLYELLKTSAQNIHTSTDWSIIFTLLECVGAGAQPPKPVAEEGQIDKGARSEGESPVNSEEESVKNDRGYTSDSELAKSPKHVARPQSPVIVPNGGGWILVGNEGEIQPIVGRTVPPSQYSLALERNLGPHDPSGMIKCCESLAFLVRDVAHITPYNFDNCVHCIRTFVEASLHGSKNKRVRRTSIRDTRKRKTTTNRRRQEAYSSRKSPASSPDEEEDSDDDLPGGYHQISIQLLDLMHTLHTRTAQIFRWWAEEGGEVAQETSLWTQGWCPLLQGIARLCCDIRKQVRMSAITYLQRALLVHDLQTLSGPEWEACFQRVLFPLLNYLLQPISKDHIAMEETRMRAATLLSKVFLHHLTPLLSLPTFCSLWLMILDFLDRYMHADKSDLLYEAIPESLKNMLLVMDSAKVFGGDDGYGQLWGVTWERIGRFLPHMKEELFKEQVERGVQEVEVKNEQKTASVAVTQHNIENATRSSIILQPPQSSQHTVSSPLFAHLGQMVSTPIGPTVVAEDNTKQKVQTSHGHTFPVLYNNPLITTTSPLEVQPVSLYSEYINNPYNTQQGFEVAAVDNADGGVQITNVNVLWEQYLQQKQSLQCQANLDGNKNLNEENRTDMFRSANYFNTDSNVIPPGSEILFGTAQAANNIPNITSSSGN